MICSALSKAPSILKENNPSSRVALWKGCQDTLSQDEWPCSRPGKLEGSPAMWKPSHIVRLNYLESQDILSTEIDLTPFFIQPNQRCSYTVFNGSTYISVSCSWNPIDWGTFIHSLWSNMTQLSVENCSAVTRSIRTISAEKTRFSGQIPDTVWDTVICVSVIY